MPLIVSKAGKSRLSGERLLRKGGCLQQIEVAGAGGGGCVLWGVCGLCFYYLNRSFSVARVSEQLEGPAGRALGVCGPADAPAVLPAGSW